MFKRFPFSTRLILIVVITGFFFSPVIQGNFTHVDDDVYVYQNEHVRQGLSTANIVWALQSIEVSNWHPLTWLSYMVDVELFGLSANQMHIMNLLLHLVNSVLIFLLISRFFNTTAAFLATLIFAIHPLHVEPVVWISERKEVLSFFFLLLATHAYVSYKRQNRLAYYAASLVAFACALMSKPMAVSFPLLIILLDYWPLKRWPQVLSLQEIKNYSLEKLPFVLLSAFACFMAIKAHSDAIDTVSYYSLGSRLILVTMAYVEYIKLFLSPVGLAFYYPMPVLELSPYFWGCLALLLALSVASVGLMKRYPFLFVAWWWYIVSLLPVIGLLKVGGQFIADRYTYVPFTGIILALALLFHSLSVHRNRNFILHVVAVVVFLFYGSTTFNYTKIWKNDIVLASSAISRTADNPIAYYVLALGVASHITQQLFDELAPESDCVAAGLDVFVGIGEESLVCLQEEGSNSAVNELLYAAHLIREDQLDAAEELLKSIRETSTSDTYRQSILLTAVHRVADNDLENLQTSVNNIRALPEDGVRSFALFLCYYQLGQVELASDFINEGIRTLPY